MYFTRQIPARTLVVHKRRFVSEEEAHEWNGRTGICLNFELMTDEEVEGWEGDVIRVPIEREKDE